MPPNRSEKQFKIAILSSGNTPSRRYWSGSPYYMAKALERQGCQTTHLGPVGLSPRKILGKIANKTSQILFNRVYDWMDTRWLAKDYARIFKKKLAEKSFDAIVAPASRTEIAFLETKIPIVYAADATFKAVTDYYPGFTNMWGISIQEGNAIEQAAINRATAIAYASDWAARSAIKDYNANPAKVHVIPFGVNLDEIPAAKEVLKRKKADRCRLLFLGVNWRRKGGAIAFAALQELEQMGIDAELTICGCKPPGNFSHKNLKIIPFLDKNDPAQRKILAELFLASDFLLLPTRNECYGVAFCEANAFGLPVITADTGGVPTIIRNGENGFMLPPEAGGAGYAKLIAEIYRDDQRYYELVRSSRKAFDQRLNWDVWAAEVKKLIFNLL